jgi:hypothetical protein
VRFAGRPLHRPAELWAPVDPAVFWKLAFASAENLATPYLSMAVRSDCLLHPAQAIPIKQKIESLCDGPMAKRVAFMTPTEALSQLIGNG